MDSVGGLKEVGNHHYGFLVSVFFPSFPFQQASTSMSFTLPISVWSSGERTFA